jgi:hypothetical protein
VVRVKLVRVRGALSLRGGLASPWPVDTIGPVAPSLCSGGYSMYGIGAHGVGAQTTDPVSTVSECVYTQQQPIVRHRILSETLKVLKSASGRIHGMLPWPVRGRPQDGHRWRPVREKLHRFHFINKSLRNTIFAESNNRYTFSSCALPIFKSP